MPRMYEADRAAPPQQYNVTQPFRPDFAPMTLTRWTGNWKHVQYAGNGQPAAYSTTRFADDDLTGVYSTGFGYCACLCLLCGRVNKHTGDYYSGALAHLDAGDINGLNLSDFIANSGYSPAEIAQGSAVNSWFFHLVLAGSSDSLTHFTIERTLDKIRSEIKIADQCITIYIGLITNGFGITRQGWVGVPTFGTARAQAPLWQDR